MKKYLLGTTLLIFTFVLFTACGGNEQDKEIVPDEISQAVSDGHNAKISLDYAGTYQGVTPCADCEGIEVTLTITEEDTYTLYSKYLGKGEGTPIALEGSYDWVDGNTIELSGITDAPNKFHIGENQIWQLDMEGKRIEGDLADKYILRKI